MIGVTHEDLAVWQHSAGLLLRLVVFFFLCTGVVTDLVVGALSYFELLMFELASGEPLCSEKRVAEMARAVSGSQLELHFPCFPWRQSL